MLNSEELKEWISQNGTGEMKWKYFNGLSYLFTNMNDGWIAVFEFDNGLYIPAVQARDISHAESWCVLRERPKVPLNTFRSIGRGGVSDAGTGWGFYIIADLKTWAGNAGDRSELEHFPSFEAAKARFEELRGEPYNSEAAEPGPDGQPPARLTLGLESTDGLSAVDILHVRQGQNYLVTDFTQIERLAKDPTVSEILCRTSWEIGFDLVQPSGCPPVPFGEWDNPHFPAATMGSIAAGYYNLLHACYPLPKDEPFREGAVAEIMQFLQNGGKTCANQMSLTVASLASENKTSEAVQKQAEVLMKELDYYKKGFGKEKASQKKQRRISPER